MTTHKEELEAAEAAWRASIEPTCARMLESAITAYLSAMAGAGGEVVERAQAAIAHLGEAGVMSAKDATALLSDLLALIASQAAEVERLTQEMHPRRPRTGEAP